MKLKTLILLILAVFGLRPIAHAETGTLVKVTGKRINLRARPEMTAEVVGQVGDDAILRALSFQDEWVEVLAPESVDVWVHKDFVADNRVVADRLYVRGGPGINWQTVGQMARGDPVVIRGEFGDWLKIAPPPSCTLWVSRKYVEVLEPKKPAPPPPMVNVREPPPQSVHRESARQVTQVSRPAVASRDRAQATTASSAASEPLAPVSADTTPAPPPPDLKLIPLEGQGRRVQREGYLRLAGFVLGRPSRYRLAVQQGSRIQTICYVRGNNSQLASFLGRRVLIRGREYWIRGVKDPVLVPEEIVPYAR